MTLLRRVTLAAIAALVSVPVLTAGPTPGQTQPVIVREVGWWSRQTGAMPQGAGAFRVGRQPDGDTSVAALRLDVHGAIASATLALTESGGVAADQAALRVCTTSSPWTPANPGAFASAPTPDCARAVPFERDAATGIWRASISTFLSSGTTSLMVVPDPARGFALFQVDVGSAAVHAEAAPSPEGDALTPTPAEPEPASPAATSGFNSDTASLPLAMPPVELLLPAPLPSPEAATIADAAPTDGTVPFVTAATGSRRGSSKPWGRLLWMVPTAAVVGIVVARRPAPRG